MNKGEEEALKILLDDAKQVGMWARKSNQCHAHWKLRMECVLLGLMIAFFIVVLAFGGR